MTSSQTTVRFETVVSDIRLQSRSGLSAIWIMSLDHTEFRIGDTGLLEAVTRKGSRITLAVSDVTADDQGTVWHTVEKPLAAGTEITGVVSRRDPIA